MKGFAGIPVTLMLVLIGVSEIEMVPEAMKQLTGGFLKVLDQCKKELNLSDGVISDLYHLWKEEYDQISRDAGCVIHCMSQKLELVGGDGKMHHVNIKDFALKHGAGDEIATQLVTLAHECEKQKASIEDDCERTLEMSKCFRSDVKQVDWTPKMEVIITEVIEV
uniref:Pheromone binding protein 5 n=1 Tax=Ostrinia nubilalis TaxID=29057 RepID=E7CC98_OSTNU|nr:pheromone binding protein 5 [Ostrinia nubilalis]